MIFVGPIGCEFEIAPNDPQDLRETKARLLKDMQRLPKGEARSVINFLVGAIDATIDRTEKSK